MKVVIPMAGKSKRFQDAGYKVPKYLIDIDGRLMIDVKLQEKNLKTVVELYRI